LLSTIAAEKNPNVSSSKINTQFIFQGKNMRTQEEGLFPSHKVKEETKFVDFPQFLDEATRIRKEGEPLK